ncbi:MAG: response regulator [Bacteroidota bacterium]
MSSIRLMIADDQRLFLESLQAVLKAQAPDIEVVGIAQDGKGAFDLASSLRPDIILMDVRMPVMDGVESMRRIRAVLPEIKVLMLTTFDDDGYVREALRLGAVGYLLKDMAIGELINGIRTVHEGGVLIASKVAACLVASTSTNERADQKETAEVIESLSDREKQVLMLLAQGLDNAQIGRALFISEYTVKNHISSIYNKLGVHDRVCATRRAIQGGLAN